MSENTCVNGVNAVSAVLDHFLLLSSLILSLFQGEEGAAYITEVSLSLKGTLCRF